MTSEAQTDLMGGNRYSYIWGGGAGGELSSLPLDDDANCVTPEVTLRKSSKHFEECGDKTTKIITEHFLPRELYVETAGETGNSLSSNKDCPGDWVLVLTLKLTLRSGAGHVTWAVSRVNCSLWGNSTVKCPDNL